MTVEIRELVIKATVAGETKAGNPAPDETGTQVTRELDTQKIVARCVAEVMKILKREKER